MENAGNREVMLTGDRPTGPLHLGHYAGSLVKRVEMQESGRCRCFVMIADMQALTDNAETSAKVRDAVPGLVADYLATGIDPEKTTVFLQSAVPELAELTALYMNLVSVSRLERNPTVRDETKQKGFGDVIPAGFLCYPVSQAADITAFRATLVPVGKDQSPMVEIAQEIAGRVNRLSGAEILPQPKAVYSRVARLPGIDGREKAGKSLGNAIFLSDTADEVRRKVMDMFTDPGHLRVEDPGKVEGNAVFAYLDAFDPDREEVEALKERYRRGGLGDVALKRRLAGVLEEILAPVRERRNALAADPQECLDVLRGGTAKAREAAAATLSDVKRGLGLTLL